MSPTLPIVQQAIALPLPKAKTWRTFVCSRFSGTMPPEVTEAPTVLEIIPGAVAWEDGEMSIIKGHFEYSMDLSTARVGVFAGEINSREHTFHFTSKSDKDPWSFEGRFSDNGQVMILRLGWEDGFKSEEFCLIQVDTFASLLPEDEFDEK